MTDLTPTQRILKQLFEPHVLNHRLLKDLNWNFKTTHNGIEFHTEYLTINFYYMDNVLYVRSDLPGSFIVPGPVSLAPKLDVDQLNKNFDHYYNCRQEYIEKHKT
jgi:hypothetical protein